MPIVRPRSRWLAAAAIAGVALASQVAPLTAGGAEVTRGRFHAFAAGAGMDIGGHAVMVRTADGRTFVSVHVTGLASGTTYGSHVHKQACADGAADGHYQFIPGGAVDHVNEIWPGFTTNSDGIGNGRARNEGTAGATAVSVVVHAPGGAKIACADLE